VSFWSYSTQGPRWVWLPMADGLRGVFDANKVFSVQEGKYSNLTVINDDWRKESVICAPIKNVCAALSIPYVEEKKK
jgi:hypothetical protein